MAKDKRHIDINKLSFFGFIITLGIVFGDLGTSPLYVMQAIIRNKAELNELIVIGSMSCIFWTLTLQTTIKYVIITLRADNRGEGGIFALFALLGKKQGMVALLAMAGASALLADGVITPAITVTSAVEGLQLLKPDIPVIWIVLAIFAVLFFMQRYGTNIVGGIFGSVMLVWFLMLATIGAVHLGGNPGVLRAIDPGYAIKFLTQYPGAFLLLGAVFLATTGAEALYSDLGHCGIRNIRVSWFFVKAALLLNYFGQCAWILDKGDSVPDLNPFYGIMPGWFLIPGIIISTAAAVIASQALISGSFTLVSEAVSLNFWPKFKIENPTHLKGQVYVPYINWFLWIACSGVVLIFRESTAMEAAYGLSITITMIMTTLLLSFYLSQQKKTKVLIFQFLLLFLLIEGSFLIANLHKFSEGGWLTILLASVFFTIMSGWHFGRKLKNRFVTYIRISGYESLFKDLSRDESVPKFATNLAYIVNSGNVYEVESKVIYSIFRKQPKRADTYWFIHVIRTEDPETFNYKATELIPGIVIRIDFSLGFRIEPNIGLYFSHVLEDLCAKGIAKHENGYESMRKHNIEGDFQFLLIDRLMPRDVTLNLKEKIILALHGFTRMLSISDIQALHLDPTNTFEEKVPVELDYKVSIPMKRIG